MSKFVDRTTLIHQETKHDSVPELTGIESIKHIIAVVGGKGGVGNSTVAINLALALSSSGLKVGLVDADGSRPGLAMMLGLQQARKVNPHSAFPIEKFGLSVMAADLFEEEIGSSPWETALGRQAFYRLLGQVHWGRLDVLIIDLPSGITTASLTMAQSLPFASLVMVTTPQELSLANIRRSLDMFRHFNIRILGLVENMSFFMCGHKTEPLELFGIFSAGGGQRLSEETGLPLLATIPIEKSIEASGDGNTPLLISDPDSESAGIFKSLADEIWKRVPDKAVAES